MVTIKLNHFDEEGDIVDADSMEISEAGVSDIIDHAAQLCILQGSPQFYDVLSSLEEALRVYGVL